MKRLLGGLDEKALAELGTDSLNINLNDRHVNRVLERTPQKSFSSKGIGLTELNSAPMSICSTI